MYAIKPGFEPPQKLADVNGMIHQSTLNAVEGPFSCMARFKYVNIDGYRAQPTGSMLFGTAWDRLQYAQKGKIQAHADTEDDEDGYFTRKLAGAEPTVEQSDELFAHYWENQAKEAEDLTDAEKDGLMKLGRIHTKHWAEHFGKLLEPVDLHLDLSIPMADHETGEEWFMRGSLDMTAKRDGDKKPHLRDAKTSKSAWAKDKALALPQAPHYSLLVKASGMDHVDSDTFIFEVMVKNKTKPNISDHAVKIGDLERTTHIKRCMTIRDIIGMAWKTGDFIPNRQCMTCSRSMCGFWEQCEKDHGGRVKGEVKPKSGGKINV